MKLAALRGRQLVVQGVANERVGEPKVVPRTRDGCDEARSNGFVELPEQGACSVVLSLQGRAEQVEAFCTIEPLDVNATAPPAGDVVALLLAGLRRRLGPAASPSSP